MPAKVEKKVASRMGTNISVGWVAPSCARYTMMLIGMSGIKILPVTGCPLGISGKSLLNRGPSNRENRVMTPPCSPILMIPSQRERTPVSPNEISKAVLEELKVELIISGNTCVSPRKTSRINATTKAIRKKAIQM